MSTTLQSNTIAETVLESQVTKEESGFLDSDNPLEVYKRYYPKDKNPEAALVALKKRILVHYVRNVHDEPVDMLIQKSGLSKYDVDILCISLIESDNEFSAEAQRLYDECNFVNAKFISKDPYAVSSKELYVSMYISR